MVTAATHRHEPTVIDYEVDQLKDLVQSDLTDYQVRAPMNTARESDDLTDPRSRTMQEGPVPGMSVEVPRIDSPVAPNRSPSPSRDIVIPDIPELPPSPGRNNRPGQEQTVGQPQPCCVIL